jgi:hypothetical protein
MTRKERREANCSGAVSIQCSFSLEKHDLHTELEVAEQRQMKVPVPTGAGK